MFTTETDGHILALKPMNCPCHVQIFRQGLKSYRDLPLRMAEFGSCHRNEPSGALHGLMRARAFTQDDAHIFCTEDKAETALRDACAEAGLGYELNPGEGAFYGPKLEFVLRDAIGRQWQCGTLQVDFVLPERLDASYVGEDGDRHRPVMLHRAILGSMERFIGILIQHHAGRMPLWMAPLQVAVATITSQSDAYAAEVARRSEAVGLRVLLDQSNEKITYKVRRHSVAKIPVMLVVGKKEAEQESVSVRRLGGKEQEILALGEALDRLEEEAAGPAF